MSLTQAQIIELAKNQPSSGYSTQQVGDIAQTAQQTTTRADNPAAFAISPEMQAVVGAQSSGQLDTGNQQAVTDFVQNYRKSAAPPAPPPDPLLSLSPAQRAEFSKQFSIALSKGQVGDQSSVDAFKSSFVAGASGGGVPTLASTQPRSTFSNSGASMTSQGDVSGASSTASGTSSRYGLGMSGMSPEEEELTRQLETVEKPKTAEEIAAERTQSAQAEINAINENYNNQLVEQGRVNDLRSAEANAQSVLSGLTGSTEAGTRAVNVAGYNAQENRKIQGERALALATLYRGIQNDARTEARQQQQDFRTNATSALASMSARRAANVAKAEKSVIALASAGTTVDGLKSTDPQTYQYLADMVGGEEQLKAMFVLNRPQETIIDKKFENGKYIIAYKTPDGGVRIETMDTGLPPDVKTQVMDNNLYSSEDGGVTWKLAIAGKPDQLKQLQIQKAQLEIRKSEKDLLDATEGSGTQTQQVALVLNSLKDAKTLSGASGRSGIRRGAESLTVGATDYTNLVAKANSIRANMLALVSDPNIKKFFGPQMSNADVQFMMSAGTTLNPELQSPEELKGEIERLEAIFSDKNKWKNVDWGVIDEVTNKTGGQTITAPDGNQVIIID